MITPMAAIGTGSKRPSLVSLCSSALATGFGSGYSPFAPGTAGSLVGLVLFWPLQRLDLGLQVVVVIAVFVLGVAVAGDVARRVGREDPGIVVVDEVVGMWISLLALPWGPGVAFAGFFLFRIMDVVKPFPARRLEDLPAGWGIMADDVMAGIYANVALRLGLLLVSRFP
jgi:phosphatidylglycerophosphatase A